MFSKSNIHRTVTVSAHQLEFIEVSQGVFIEPGKKKNEVRFPYWVKIEILILIFVLVLLLNHCI